MPNDSDARWYDNSTIYKSSVIKDEKKLTGYPFVMVYNARGDSINPAKGAERISMAVSNDMVHWKRFGKEPVINHHKGISGDAVIQKIGNVYVMFYFGAFWPDQDAAAFNRFACSYDLMHWTDWKGPNLIEPTEEYDRLFAHKSCVIKHKDNVYHFYNAVDKKGNRGIALATSKDIGKSNIKFKSDKESAIK
jgi:sucrose-6-phosphate hydrolase SacC (GH32 family)